MFSGRPASRGRGKPLPHPIEHTRGSARQPLPVIPTRHPCDLPCGKVQAGGGSPSRWLQGTKPLPVPPIEIKQDNLRSFSSATDWFGLLASLSIGYMISCPVLASTQYSPRRRGESWPWIDSVTGTPFWSLVPCTSSLCTSTCTTATVSPSSCCAALAAPSLHRSSLRHPDCTRSRRHSRRHSRRADMLS